jgi:hypothetical protein
MPLSPSQLRRELRNAGIANAAIDAVWPQWWSDEAEGSLSANAELIFTVARRLGLSPRSLFDGSAEFLWRDETKFKKLGTRSLGEEAALASFGMAVGSAALSGVEMADVRSADAFDLRNAITTNGHLVDGRELVYLCWTLGIPVLQLHVFPLGSKRMHAMTVRFGERYAILLAHSYRYSAQLAYLLAHELGHIFLGHLVGSDAILESEDPVTAVQTDAEELEADRFGLELLTGTSDPQIVTDTVTFTAGSVAATAEINGPRLHIDPGVLALCLGHATGKWKQAVGALKILQPAEVNIAAQVNETARRQLLWDRMSFANREYLEAIMGLRHDS